MGLVKSQSEAGCIIGGQARRMGGGHAHWPPRADEGPPGSRRSRQEWSVVDIGMPGNYNKVVRRLNGISTTMVRDQASDNTRHSG